MSGVVFIAGRRIAREYHPKRTKGRIRKMNRRKALAVGLAGGISVGGSVSGTIQLQSIGGKSRWANIFTGVFATICVLLIAPFIERIPMATLAGTLIVVGVQMINVPRIETVWHTGWLPMAVLPILDQPFLVTRRVTERTSQLNTYSKCHSQQRKANE